VTRFVVDARTVVRLAAEQREVEAAHELLAPTLLRSQVLSLLHEAVARGDLGDAAARDQLEAVGRLKIRLLGDAVLRRTAWKVADRLGWASTYAAEYVALVQLQGDVLVTADVDLSRDVQGVVATAPFEALLRPAAH
jgi:predicted nucleic acid-binding protein